MSTTVNITFNSAKKNPKIARITVANTTTGFDFADYRRFTPKIFGNTLQITLSKDETEALAVNQNLSSASMTDSGVPIPAYVSFAQKKWLGRIYPSNRKVVAATVTVVDFNTTVLEVILPAITSRSTVNPKPAVKPVRSVPMTAVQQTIPAAVAESLLQTGQGQIKTIVHNGVTYTVI